MLLLPIQDSLLEKRGSKENLIVAPKSWDNKVILTLLNKIVAVYMRYIFMDVWGSELESLFSRFVEIYPSNRRPDFQDCFEDLL